MDLSTLDIPGLQSLLCDTIELADVQGWVAQQAPYILRPGVTGPAPIHPLIRALSGLRAGLDGCWLWSKTTSRGYGQLNVGSRTLGDPRKLPVHVVIYEAFYGPVPTGLQVDHTCHNDAGCLDGVDCLHRRCGHPLHLEAVEPIVNVRRQPRVQLNSVATHCKRGHPWDEENTYEYDKNGTKYRYCKICVKMTVEERKLSLSHTAVRPETHRD